MNRIYPNHSSTVIVFFRIFVISFLLGGLTLHWTRQQNRERLYRDCVHGKGNYEYQHFVFNFKG